MILTIDVGNTRIKGAVFEGDKLLEKFTFDKENFNENILKIIEYFPSVSDIVVATVADIDFNALSDLAPNVAIHYIDHETVFPFDNKYATPKTLGIDRMVLAAGATLQFPGMNRLIIDAGTCVTYDFVDAEDNYLGGAISPGLRLRYESLHNFTSKLPLLQLSMPEKFIGDQTTAAIHSGVVNGLVYEINGFIDEYEALGKKIIIILTGGDADFLAKRLKNTIFANSNFLLESLKQTFQYKIKND